MSLNRLAAVIAALGVSLFGVGMGVHGLVELHHYETHHGSIQAAGHGGNHGHHK